MELLITITSALKSSGLPGLFISAIGIAAVVIIIEKYKSLFMKNKLDAGQFISKVKDYVYKDEIGKAITFCDANKEMPSAQAVKAVLERADRDEASMYHAVELTLGEMEPELFKRMDYLPMLANVSTLVGLLGTIVGLIYSFSALATVSAEAKQVALSNGISMAMSTTAMGLACAIPILLMFSYLNSRFNKLIDQSQHQASVIIDVLKARVFS